MLRTRRRLNGPIPGLRHGGAGCTETLRPAAVDEAEFESGFTRGRFIAAVGQCREYIRAGDVFQVVPSQRLSVPFHARPVDVYRALRALNPSPYMYFIDVGDTQVVGASPAILARLQYDDAGRGTVTMRPLAGTRPRGKTPEEDAALEAELPADPKERAERSEERRVGKECVSPCRSRGSQGH